MPKKTKSRKTEEEEWKDWGEKFGERMRQRGEEIGEEARDAGQRVRSRINKRWRRYLWPFGIVWPLVGSIFFLILLIIGITLLGWLNIGLGSTFVAALIAFVYSNLNWLFAASLFFGYARYLLRSVGVFRWLFSPIVVSLGIVFVAWLAAAVLNALNVSARSALVAGFAGFLSANLFGVFVVFLVLGYVFMIARMFLWSMFGD